MNVQTKTTRAGRVGILPEGPYNPDTEYDILAEVIHDHDSWISKHAENKGNTPQDGSAHWQRSTEGGAHAYEQGELARAKREEITTLGDYAKRQADRAQALNDHPWELRDDGYIWVYSEGAGAMVRSSRMVFSAADLTDEQIAAAIEKVAAQHLIGPAYDAAARAIKYPVTSSAVYIPAARSIDLG